MEHLPWCLALLVLLRCSLEVDGQTQFSEGYFGCFVDSVDYRTFLWWQTDKLKDQDPLQCRKICQDNAFLYFGFTGPKGSDCYCGNSGLDRKRVNDGECQRCVRNGYSFQCGKLDTRIAVYKTSASLAVDRRYVGCWKGGEDVFPDRFDATAELRTAIITISDCMGICFARENFKYKFVALIGESQCLCGVKPVSQGTTTVPVLAGNCIGQCKGFRDNSPCGDMSTNDIVSVYRIDHYVGCYKANMRDFTYSFWHWPETYRYVPAGSCINYCFSLNFRFAALTTGGDHDCYCGNYGMELRNGGYSEACPENCNRNNQVFFCAERSAIAVYDTLLPDVPDERYVACYGGDAGRVMGAFLNVGDTGDKEECLNRCRQNNRPYAGRWNNVGCYCGDAILYRNGQLKRVAGENNCNDMSVYWSACPTRGDYKPDCSEKCNCANYEICDPHFGNCPDLQCAAGYTKDTSDTTIYQNTCQKLCPVGTFGRDCANKCNCLNGVFCDAETGKCDEDKCDQFWTGPTCSDPITCTGYRKYGPGCTADCNCYANDDCNDQTGECNNKQCQVGLRMDDKKRCTLPCQENRFGKDCNSRCFCDGQTCNKVDGSCPSRVCKKGYSSNRCNIMDVNELLVGCFNDDPQERVLFWWPDNQIDHTAKECINVCFDQNFKFAGLSKEGSINGCFCGNFGFESRGISSKCTTCTKVTEVFPCAPSDSISIFTTYGSGDPDQRYMGCWVAPPQIIDPATQARFRNPHTAVSCIEECRTNNFKYSAVLNATECFCGNDLQRNNAWKTSNTACSTLCSGYSSTFDPTCGGPSALSIYRAVCSPGTHGPSCQFQCRCEDGKECKDTGECPDRRCEPGYTYSQTSLRCEIPCGAGQFGVNCVGRCYCKDGSNCNTKTGECPDGCRIGFQGLNCSVTQERYMGCFRDDLNEPSMFWWQQNDYIQKTADDCVDQCFRNGFKFAALTDGNENECSCGNSGFGQYGRSVQCYSCSRGAKTFTCAPRGSIAVYRTFLNPEPPDLRHIGCWMGSSISEVLDPIPVRIYDNQGDLTVDYCCTECAKRGYRYAGLMERQDCHCGNNLRRSTLRTPGSPTNCDKKCLGDDITSPPCGGERNTNSYMSVYRAECRIGKWGSRCEKNCNCLEGQRCNNTLGTCPFNDCAASWLLNADQTCSKKCEFRKFGLSCEKDCNCAKNTGCNNITGQCDIGYCNPGYRGISCSQRCSYESYGENCTYACNCGALECNHITGACGATSESPRSIPSIELLTFALISLIFLKTLTLLKPAR